MCRLFGISYGDTPENVPTSTIAAVLFHHLTGGGKHAYGWFHSDGEEVWSGPTVVFNKSTLRNLAAE